MNAPKCMPHLVHHANINADQRGYICALGNTMTVSFMKAST